jgi:hypothetical protein
MTNPLGKYWEQPNREDILVDDTHAVMTRNAFNHLKEYSVTNPTGAYEGKMWKSRGRKAVKNDSDQDVGWVWTDVYTLCWYGPDPKNEPGYVGNYYREILLID